jgi:hypothetical protein
MTPDTELSLEELKYPIGKYQKPESLDAESRKGWISIIGALPSWLDVIIENLDAAQLDTPYRPGGWTMVQTIHHIFDSHMNGFLRVKLALTEDYPTIKPYKQDLWADTPEVFSVPVNVSITGLHALHRRWTALLEGLSEEQWRREFIHPERPDPLSIAEMTALYAWHCRHHFEHLRRLRTRMSW